MPSRRCRRTSASGPREAATEGVAVGELLAAGVDLGVEAGADQVADSGVVPVGQGGLWWADSAELGELGLHPAGQVGGFGVGSGQEQDVFAAQVVGEPHRGGALVGRFLVGAADPAVSVIDADRGQVTVAEPDAGLPFPCGGEPADLMQFGGGDFGGQEAEHAACLDGAELGGVAGGDDPGSGLPGRLDDQGQVGGVELAGLIQDQNIVLVQREGGAAGRSLRSCRGMRRCCSSRPGPRSPGPGRRWWRWPGR